jgi:hypothetical protein
MKYANILLKHFMLFPQLLEEKCNNMLFYKLLFISDFDKPKKYEIFKTFHTFDTSRLDRIDPVALFFSRFIPLLTLIDKKEIKLCEMEEGNVFKNLDEFINTLNKLNLDDVSILFENNKLRFGPLLKLADKFLSIIEKTEKDLEIQLVTKDSANSEELINSGKRFFKTTNLSQIYLYIFHNVLINTELVSGKHKFVVHESDIPDYLDSKEEIFESMRNVNITSEDLQMLTQATVDYLNLAYELAEKEQDAINMQILVNSLS